LRFKKRAFLAKGGKVIKGDRPKGRLKRPYKEKGRLGKKK
jgi:hypothetical protein